MTKQAPPPLPRAAYTVEEFSSLFGHAPAWGYRMLNKNKVKPIKGFGKTMIAAAEVDRITRGGGEEDGK